MTSDVQERLRNALAGDHRSADHKSRDAVRRPLEMYTFFGLTPEMTVVDTWPTAGWTTEILAPVLRDTGALISTHFAKDHKDDLCRRQRGEFEKKLADAPHLYDQVSIQDFGKGLLTYADPESVDLVVTLRNFHNWMWGDYLEPALESFFRVLKPGGILGLEEHRGDPKQSQDEQAKTLYVRQDYVIDKVTQHGFVFEAASEINANPKDTKDHPRGALSLPPNYWGVDDKAPYDAIGESDRMVLRFRKPATS